MKTILLADDSITIQKVVELTFSEADYRVVCVSSGGQALKKVPEVRPDVILLDVIMPEKNGYEVCEQLKRSPATSGIPVLLLTGTFEPFDKKRADAAGANGHLTKPFESQSLVAKVEELIASTPSVAVDDQGGRMDIISGGDIYHVDPERAAEGLRPLIASAGGGVRTAALEPSHAEPVSPPIPGAAGRSLPPAAGEEKEAEARPHPALAPPDPAAGGAYVGFADIGLDPAMDGSIVPDRFDEPGGGGASTVRLRRDHVVSPRGEVSSGSSGGGSGPVGSGADEAFGGSFEAEFDLVDELPPGPPLPDVTAEPESAPAWIPPPEAPPAETWQVSDEAPVAPAPAPPAARDAGEALAGDGRRLGLTPEMIDLIAEKVVERLSDRVVREIAWEVVPGVAETLVRRRIKDLEEG